MQRTAPLTLAIALATPLWPGIGGAGDSQWGQGLFGEGVLGDRLQIHGFASQTAVKSSDNSYYGDSRRTSLDLTELGLNASYRLNPRVLFSGQVLSRRAGEMYDGSLSLDFALADLVFASDSSRLIGGRIGRIKNPIGLYNETRDVPFTRPGIFLPQVVYFDKVRNLLLSTDGAMGYGEIYGDWGTVTLNGGGGQAIIDDNVEWTFLGTDFPGQLKPDGLSWVGSLWYSTPAERLRLGLSAWNPSYRFKTDGGSPIEPGTVQAPYWVASTQYNDEDWTLSAEYARIDVKWNDFGPSFPFRKNPVEGWYLQGAYRIRPNLELMLRWEEGYNDRKDRRGERNSALTGGYTPPFDFFSKILTAGIRWDPTPYLMLRLEYQHHNGTFATSFRENTDPNELREHWDVIAASVSLRF